jgi:hypothetical protein
MLGAFPNHFAFENGFLLTKDDAAAPSGSAGPGKYSSINFSVRMSRRISATSRRKVGGISKPNSLWPASRSQPSGRGLTQRWQQARPVF